MFLVLRTYPEDEDLVFLHVVAESLDDGLVDGLAQLEALHLRALRRHLQRVLWHLRNLESYKACYL